MIVVGAKLIPPKTAFASNNYIDMLQLADLVYVISLPERVDRRSRIEEVFKAEQIAFEFVDGIRVQDGDVSPAEVAELYWAEFKIAAGWDAYLRAAVGCKRAHMKCFERALASEVGSLLVFEDDVAFRPNWYPILQNAKQDLPSGWLQLYLSAASFEPVTPVTKNLERLGAACQTTAILYSRDGIEAAMSCATNARAEIDWWMGLHLHPFGCSFVSKPQITYQTGGFSDCRGTYRGEMP